MSSPQTQSGRLSGEERGAQILAVAREEFLARGLAGARIHEVARAAGVTNALIYKHFRSKEELFERAVMQPLEDALEEVIATMRALPADPAGQRQHESMLAFVRALLELFSQSGPGLGVVLFGERGTAQDFYARHLRPLIEASIDVGKVNLDRWPHRAYDIETAVQAAFGMTFWLALDRSMRDTDDDLDERARNLTDIIMHGVAAS